MDLDLSDVWVLIPIGPREKYLPEVLETLHDYKGRVVIVNNMPDYTIYEDVHHLEDMGDVNISRWWNVGFKYIRDQGGRYVLVLNDDVRFKDWLPEALLRQLLELNGTICSVVGGGGAMFIMDLEDGIEADEDLKWWCGDGDIFRQAYEAKGFCWFGPTDFEQLEPSVLTFSTPRLKELADQDLVTYRNKLAKLGKTDYYGQDQQTSNLLSRRTS